MEVHYAEILYVELKPNVLIPNEWPIQGIESLVLCLAEKIIMDPRGLTYILQINDIPAKLIQRPTESGCVYVFQKVPYEEVVDAHLCDVGLPIDDRSVRIKIVSRENQFSGSWPNYCATGSLRDDEMSYHITPSCFKKEHRNTGANDPKLRHILRCFKRLSSSYIIILLTLISISLLVFLLSI